VRSKYFSPVRFLAAYFCICSLLLLTSLSYAADSKLKVHFIDVGYGDAIFIELPNQSNILIDTGSIKSSVHLIDYLLKRKITVLNTVFITHPHPDHYGGLEHLADGVKIDQIFINGDGFEDSNYSRVLDLMRDRQISLETLKRNEVIQFASDIVMDILNPLELTSNLNGNSLVLLLTYEDVQYLFMGDVEKKEQEEIFTLFPDLKDVDCIKTPHHGRGISERFDEIFKEKTFIISVGQNKWGMPSKDDLDLLNGNIFRTDEGGTIIVSTDGNQLDITRD